MRICFIWLYCSFFIDKCNNCCFQCELLGWKTETIRSASQYGVILSCDIIMTHNFTCTRVSQETAWLENIYRLELQVCKLHVSFLYTKFYFLVFFKFFHQHFYRMIVDAIPVNNTRRNLTMAFMQYNQEGLGKPKGQQLLAFQKSTIRTPTPLSESLSAGLQQVSLKIIAQRCRLVQTGRPDGRPAQLVLENESVSAVHLR